MNTAGPATRPAHSALKLGECLLDTDVSRLCFLAGDDPTNPLVACERRNVVPHGPCRRRLIQGLLPIARHCMHRPAGKLDCRHTLILSNPLKRRGFAKIRWHSGLCMPQTKREPTPGAKTVTLKLLHYAICDTVVIPYHSSGTSYSAWRTVWSLRWACCPASRLLRCRGKPFL